MGNGTAFRDIFRIDGPAWRAAAVLLLALCAYAGAAEKTGSFTHGWDAYQAGDYDVALQHWLPLAQQGDALAQLNIGLLYDAGLGVAIDHERAADWYRRSAESGLAAAQYNLGLMYRDGQGVGQDIRQAQAWLGRAADQGLQSARALLASGLRPERDIDALSAVPEGAATGTAWPVAAGHAVTSAHVVAGVASVALYDATGRRYPATIVLHDEQNDIALLRIDDEGPLPPALPLSQTRTRMGTRVFTVGYPRVDVLGRSPKLSTGIVSAISGYRDDPGSYQTSVQIQPGNSGGPLFNMHGEVVGIVAAMLGDGTGTATSQPGLSYAVKVEKLRPILRSLQLQDTRSGAAPSVAADLADLAERVQASVLLVVATQ